MPLVRKPTTTPVTPATPAAGSADVLLGLKSANSEERWAAARAAAAVPGCGPAMTAALQVEAAPQVREALFSSLARKGSPEGVEQLILILRSDQSALRTGALDALRSMGNTLHETLTGLLSDQDPDIRILSCEIARAMPAEEATDILCSLLEREPRANVCAAAVEVLAEVGTAQACPVLAQCAARFHDNAFLGFAIKVAVERITSQPAPPRG